jgi:hypothetical protein
VLEELFNPDLSDARLASFLTRLLSSLLHGFERARFVDTSALRHRLTQLLADGFELRAGQPMASVGKQKLFTRCGVTLMRLFGENLHVDVPPCHLEGQP